MIGFEDKPVTEKGHPNEPPETRDLTKRMLYKTVSLRYAMPPYCSRGMNRNYLLKVHRAEAYRVSDLELRTFEVQLTPAMNKRVGILNNSFLVRKVNTLLRSRNQPELGFDEFDPPEEVLNTDQTWLYRIVRFLDPTNLLEFFEAPVTLEPELNQNSTMIQGVHWGRLKASKYFYRLDAARTDKRLWEQVKMLSTNYKSYLSHLMVVEKIQNDLRHITAQTAELERTMEDQVSKIAFTYTTIETPEVRPGMIINDLHTISKEIREKINFNCQL